MGLPQKSLQRYTCLLAYRQQCSWAVACQRRSGVYDALSAKIAAKAGHKAAFISGYAVRAFPFSCSGAVGAVLPHSVREANCSRARTSRQGIVSPARSSPSRVCSGVSSFPVAGRRSACVTNLCSCSCSAQLGKWLQHWYPTIAAGLGIGICDCVLVTHGTNRHAVHTHTHAAGCSRGRQAAGEKLH